jgi:hypothetical protein
MRKMPTSCMRQQLPVLTFHADASLILVAKVAASKIGSNQDVILIFTVREAKTSAAS